MPEKKFLIITGYFKGESYGLLGPQMAATIINEHTDYRAIVAGVANEDEKASIHKAVECYFGDQKKIIGFSSLSGRPDLFDLAKELKTKGAVTILAGPQAAADYKGEIGWENHPHRFKGLADSFSFALHGPAQQIIPVLADGLERIEDASGFPGVLFRTEEGRLIENQSLPWDDSWLSRVDWQTFYRLKDGAFKPLSISAVQVLEQIGCQHAAKEKKIAVDYPFEPKSQKENLKSIEIVQRGCSFCDVAVDKGYLGSLGRAAVKDQLACLPEGADGRKAAFELINESPLPGLTRIFELADELGISISQINLTLRADYLLKGLGAFEKALVTAREKNVRILLSSIGFESFDDTILKNLNKGITRRINLEAVKAVRDLKSRFPAHLGYLREEGGNHGFIHPTPWDSPEISRQIRKTISLYRLDLDILPRHSTPLIIHHASGLSEWIRAIESKKGVRYGRLHTTIAWWEKIR